MPASRPYSDSWLIAGLLLLAASLRVVAALTFAYTHDEVQVIQRGLEHLAAPPLTDRFNHVAFDVPLTTSNAITPLWLWIQAANAWLTPAAPVWTRLPAMLFSLVAVLLIFRLVRPRLGRATASAAALSFVLSDLCLWTGAKSEFTEPLLLVVTLLALDRMLRVDLKHFVVGALALSLAPLTYLGKGLFLYALVGLWVAATAWDRVVTSEIDRATAVREAVTRLAILAASLLPTVLWLVAAHARLKFLGTYGLVLQGDLGPIHSLVEQVRRTTIGYFDERDFLRGSWHTMLIVYHHLAAWPTSTLMAPWAALGLALGCDRLRRESQPATRALLWTLPTMGLVPFLYLLFRGYEGGRFTLLYQVPFSIAIGIGVVAVARGLLAESQRERLTAGLAVAGAGLYAALAASMTSWSNGSYDTEQLAWRALAWLVLVVFAAGGTTALRTQGAERRPTFKLLATFPLTLLLLAQLVLLTSHGPLLWGRWQGWGVEGNNATDFERRLEVMHPELRDYLALGPAVDP
ncbi:MAG: hypothetical protein AAF560_09915 [Acidobacteriota bacterium]